MLKAKNREDHSARVSLRHPGLMEKVLAGMLLAETLLEEILLAETLDVETSN